MKRDCIWLTSSLTSGSGVTSETEEVVVADVVVASAVDPSSTFSHSCDASFTGVSSTPLVKTAYTSAPLLITFSASSTTSCGSAVSVEAVGAAAGVSRWLSLSI